jgi:hypothetical protein
MGIILITFKLPIKMKLKIYLYTLGLLALASCKKIDVAQPDFNVSTTKTTFKVGEPVVFSFSGNPDVLSVYRGIAGESYDFRQRVSAQGVPHLNFTSYLLTPGQVNTLRLMASTNFSGKFDAAGVAAATWTDITSRAILSTGADNTASGNIDLSDFKVSGKPVYLAFKYAGYNHPTLKQPNWAIRTFNVNNVLPEGRTSAISVIAQTGWVAVDVKNPSVVWGVPATGQVAINGTATDATTDDNEDWVISRPYDLSAVSADVGLGLKNASTVLKSYSYTYTAAGTYTVTFIAANASVDAQKAIIKQITLTIEP